MPDTRSLFLFNVFVGILLFCQSLAYGEYGRMFIGGIMAVLFGFLLYCTRKKFVGSDSEEHY